MYENWTVEDVAKTNYDEICGRKINKIYKEEERERERLLERERRFQLNKQKFVIVWLILNDDEKYKYSIQTFVSWHI